MTIVYKVSDNLKNEIIEHYKDTKVQNTPPYAVFQSQDAGTTVTLYESGKIMFQGISADIDYAWWRDREKFLNKRDLDAELAKENAKKDKKKENKDKKEKQETYFLHNKNTVGSDEVGTGDYFGPIIVTASYVPKEDIPFLEDLGVRDSKKVLDNTIIKIAPKIIERIPHVTLTLTPEEYNKYGITNMNKVKAILHNKALYKLIHKDTYNYDFIVIDQFAPKERYYEHICASTEKVTGITFITHAEDKCLSVAVSSIISRYLFLKEMNALSEKYKMIIPKGAGAQVDEFGKEFVQKYGIDELKKCTKYNFKNTDKIKESLK